MRCGSWSERQHVVAEGAGAAPVARSPGRAWRQGPAWRCRLGGNIDPAKLAVILGGGCRESSIQRVRAGAIRRGRAGYRPGVMGPWTRGRGRSLGIAPRSGATRQSSLVPPGPGIYTLAASCILGTIQSSQAHCASSGFVPTPGSPSSLSDNAEAGSQAFSVSTGYNETALTSDLNRGTESRERWRAVTSLRRLASTAAAWAASASGSSLRHRHSTSAPAAIRCSPCSPAPARPPGQRSTCYQDWYWRGTPTARPDKHVTMFQMQGGVVFQESHSPKVRVTQRSRDLRRRFLARSRGVGVGVGFRRDYPRCTAR